MSQVVLNRQERRLRRRPGPGMAAGGFIGAVAWLEFCGAVGASVVRRPESGARRHRRGQRRRDESIALSSQPFASSDVGGSIHDPLDQAVVVMKQWLVDDRALFCGAEQAGQELDWSQSVVLGDLPKEVPARLRRPIFRKKAEHAGSS